MMQKVGIERFSVVSAKPFDEVVAGIGAAVGHPNMAEFWKSTKQAQSLSEFVWAVAREAARTADATRTKMQRENISALLHERLGCGPAVRVSAFDARIEVSKAENCQESLCPRALSP